MVDKVADVPILPRPPAARDAIVLTWASDFTRVVHDTLAKISFRVNRMLGVDGKERMTAPLRLRSYTVATRPTAADHTGGLIFVSDGAAGSKFQGSDGTSWLSLG